MPRHVEFALGDTVITSGYSVVFPEGIPVGRVVGHKRDDDDNFLFSVGGTVHRFRHTQHRACYREFQQRMKSSRSEQDKVNTSGKF